MLATVSHSVLGCSQPSFFDSGAKVIVRPSACLSSHLLSLNSGREICICAGGTPGVPLVSHLLCTRAQDIVWVTDRVYLENLQSKVQQWKGSMWTNVLLFHEETSWGQDTLLGLPMAARSLWKVTLESIRKQVGSSITGVPSCLALIFQWVLMFIELPMKAKYLAPASPGDHRNLGS